MRRLRLSSASALIALGLAACGSPQAPEEATEDTTEETAEDAAEQAVEERAPEVEAPVLAPEILALLEQARACDASTYSPPSFEMPARAEDVADADYNAAVSSAYLLVNAMQPCVFTTPSGLQFTIRQTSDEGASPISGELVTVHYRGQLIDGSEFDSSYSRGQPATFPSNRLINGWVEALPMMREGEAWTLYISPELGYGQRGTPGGPIGPNQALVFDLELLGLPGRE